MPYLIQPRAGEHSTHRSAAGLRDQANHQSDEGVKCGNGEARTELGKQTGQRARCGEAGRHRRITLAGTVKGRSMLPCSHPKIHESLVTGVSPRPTDRRQRQELRNTSSSTGGPLRGPSSRRWTPSAPVPRPAAAVVPATSGRSWLKSVLPVGKSAAALSPPLPTSHRESESGVRSNQSRERRFRLARLLRRPPSLAGSVRAAAHSRRVAGSRPGRDSG